MYIMHSTKLFHDHFEAVFDDLMIFRPKRSSISHQVIALIIYMEITFFRRHPFTFSVIPPLLETRKPHTEDTALQTQRKESRSRHAIGHIESCQVWWCYFLALLQYQKDTNSPYSYGGSIQYDSKLMMYVYYQIKCLLHIGKIELQLYVVKLMTPWAVYGREQYMPAEITKQHESYTAMSKQQCKLK